MNEAYYSPAPNLRLKHRQVRALRKAQMCVDCGTETGAGCSATYEVWVIDGYEFSAFYICDRCRNALGEG